jgi:type III pantothenate kinase
MGMNILIAVDVGNSRIKLGLFRDFDAQRLPEPESTLALPAEAAQFEKLPAWIASLPAEDLSWHIGSVNDRAAGALLDWLKVRRPDDRRVLLRAADLPINVRLERPDAVGIDRLLGAVAANALRSPRRAAVVVDLGTAITVNIISAQGDFLGGAILPGMATSARALHDYTEKLPLVDASNLNAPPAIGADTASALQSGLFWGAVGGIREIAGRAAAEIGDDPQLFVTGGAGENAAAAIGQEAKYIPHLSLMGIAIAGQRH